MSAPGTVECPPTDREKNDTPKLNAGKYGEFFFVKYICGCGINVSDLIIDIGRAGPFGVFSSARKDGFFPAEKYGISLLATGSEAPEGWDLILRELEKSPFTIRKLSSWLSPFLSTKF